MAAAVRIRPLRRDDADEVARLLDQLGYPVDGATLALRLQALLARSDTHATFVAAAESVPGRPQPLRGMVSVEWRLMIESGEQAEIVAMVTDAAARRQGLGRRLIDAACAWARARGASAVVLHSNVVRPQAHAFYPALGFACVKTQHVYRRAL